MSLTILSVAYPLTRVGPDATGGSEQVLSMLDRHLTERGHRSLVLAVEGSQVKGELLPTPPCAGELNDEVRRWGRRIHQRMLLETLNRYDVDLVHMHSLDFHTYLPASSVPTLATLHLPADWYPSDIFHHPRRNLHLNCVSLSQHQTCPKSETILPCIRNGIDVQSFSWRERKDEFLLALGRICPEKGFHLALDAAKSAEAELILAGEVFPYQEHLSYFQREIAPRLDKRRRFIGPVGFEKKRDLLARAKALLVPSLVAETSSLVTMEALASGTPVIAFKTGAIPELLSDKTGFLVSSSQEMAIAIGKLDQDDFRNHCRRAAEVRCDKLEMGNSYMDLYRSILQKAGASEPFAVGAGLSWLADVS